MDKKKTNKRFFIVSIVAVAVVVAIVAVCALCGVFTTDPLDKKVDMATYKEDIAQLCEKLSPDDQTALLSGLMLSYYKKEDMSGKPYRYFLEVGRKLQDEYMKNVSEDMGEFLREDSLQKDSLRRIDTLYKGSDAGK